MDKISVIIPVYNVEKFLARCLDSVINQTYKNLEIICVNDCSPDDSAKILEDYAKKDKRIRIITFEQNRGQSCARNQGLKVSNGEYIYFLDSDDWISTDFIENIYGIAKNKNLEAVCTTDIVDVKEDLSEKKLIQREETERFVPYYKSCLMPWCWLLKKTFLEHFKIIFPEGLKYEDTYFFNVVIRTLENVYITGSSTYYHFENKNSTMGSAQNRTINNYDIIENLKLIFKYYKENNKLKSWSIPFFYMPKYMLNIHENKPVFFEKLKSFFEEIQDEVKSNQNLYSKLELDFFNDIMKTKDYEEYKKLNLNSSVLGALRRKVKEQNGRTN